MNRELFRLQQNSSYLKKVHTNLGHHAKERPDLEGAQRNADQVLMEEGTGEEHHHAGCILAVAERHHRQVQVSINTHNVGRPDQTSRVSNG